jgi:hypothetical protein
METKQKNNDTKTREKYKNLLLRKSELSIWLDEYDDIFSDFDPSPYSDRTLSDDFLHEIKKRIHESDTGKIQLKLLLSEGKRNKERETVIVRHLHSHFKQEALQFAEHKKKMKKNGWLLTLAGLIIMGFAAWLVYTSAKHFSTSLLRVITEPAGWFLVWTGLDQVFYKSKNTNADLNFFEKMSKSEISFLSY